MEWLNVSPASHLSAPVAAGVPAGRPETLPQARTPKGWSRADTDPALHSDTLPPQELSMVSPELRHLA